MHRPAFPRLITIGLTALIIVGPLAGSNAPGQSAASREAPRFGPSAPNASGLPPPDGRTTLVSANVEGDFPSGPSAEASISESGRFVAFSSLAADLVANDTNESQDVFVVDRRNGRAVRLPLPGGEPVPPGGRAFDPSIAADASVVAFTYLPPAGFTGAVAGSLVLAWDRESNTTSIVSWRLDDVPAQGSREPSVSGDGQLVAFTSENGRISTGDGNEQADVFVYDRVSRESRLVSVNLAGRAANGGGGHPSISADGRFVAFDSIATDLVPIPGAAEIPEVYLRNLAEETTELISVNGSGGYANGASLAPSVSRNGGVVAFESVATDLVDGDTQVQDVFVRDRAAGTTVIASIGLSGEPATGPSGQASIASDGRIVAFISNAEDLVAQAGSPVELAAVAPQRAEVYARELVAGDTIRISEAIGGGPAGGSNVGPAVGGNGRYVAFASNSPRLVDGDDNKLADVFLRDLPADPVIAPPILDFGASALGVPAIPVGAIVSNRGWAPVRFQAATRSGTHAGDFSILSDGCEPQRLRRAQACTISVGFTPAGQGARTATLEVPGAFGGSPLTARLRGRGSRAVIELDPPIGSPGIVTVVTGRGFPPGATIDLNWSVGITPHLPPIVADDNGRFRVQVLVFHHDRLGERELIATRAAGPTFPEVKALMIVSASQNVPSSWGWQIRPPYGPPLIVRR
jgi:hypothetical protein